MAGFVDRTVKVYNHLSDNPSAIICLILMIVLCVGELPGANSPLEEFVKSLQEFILNNKGLLVKLAEGLKYLLEYVLKQQRVAMSVSAALFSLKVPVSVFGLLTAIVLFSFSVFSKIPFLYILVLSQINFIFINAEDITVKLVWTAIGFLIYVYSPARLIALLESAENNNTTNSKF